MSEETVQRKCTACGDSFAVSAALPPEAAPSKCPACLKSGKMSEAEAILLVQQMGEDMRRDKNDPIYFYAQRIGIFTVVLSICGLVMLLAYAQMARDEFSPLLGIFLLVSLGMGGGLTAYWARKNSRPDDPFRDI